MSLPTNFFIGRGGASGPAGGTAVTAATVSEMYAANNPAGIYWHTALTGVRSGQPFQVRYKPYGGKGWVNTFISSMPDPGDDDNWAWSSNAGWDNQQGGSGDYWLKTVNLGTNSLVVGNATGGASTLLLGPNWGATDWMCTSVNTYSEANLVATVSGNNVGGALPLVMSSDLGSLTGGTTGYNRAKELILEYFTGEGSGFDFYNGASTTGRLANAAWVKSGPNGQEIFSMLCHHRGSPQSDHWYIASSSPSSSPSSTYFGNIGYRGSSSSSTNWGGSWTSANIGSWAAYSSTGAPDLSFASSPSRIGTSNAISIWLSNM
jgi:hypothetical protein